MCPLSALSRSPVSLQATTASTQRLRAAQRWCRQNKTTAVTHVSQTMTVASSAAETTRLKFCSTVAGVHMLSPKAAAAALHSARRHKAASVQHLGRTGWNAMALTGFRWPFRLYCGDNAGTESPLRTGENHDTRQGSALATSLAAVRRAHICARTFSFRRYCRHRHRR